MVKPCVARFQQLLCNYLVDLTSSSENSQSCRLDSDSHISQQKLNGLMLQEYTLQEFLSIIQIRQSKKHLRFSSINVQHIAQCTQLYHLDAVFTVNLNQPTDLMIDWI